MNLKEVTRIDKRRRDRLYTEPLGDGKGYSLNAALGDNACVIGFGKLSVYSECRFVFYKNSVADDIEFIGKG